MSKPINMVGQKFGMLKAIARAGSSPRSKALWSCACDCGSKIIAEGASLRSGNTKSCGCISNTSNGEAASKTPEYSTWESMISRCENQKNGAWHDYGGRGIIVCPAWRASFKQFLADMGRKPTKAHTIERRNNDGNYEPLNCRWATRAEQNANQRRRQNKNWRFAAKHAYTVVRSFEDVLASYSGARYAVTCDSCTDALMLAVAYRNKMAGKPHAVEIPARTYVSVPQSIIRAGSTVKFRDEQWAGMYELTPLKVFDCARWFTSNMYRAGTLMCVSFHWTKHLPIGRGGAILCDDKDAVEWLKRARFDGRKEGVSPKNDKGLILGWHSYLTPDRAANGLMLMADMPEHNDPLPNDDYPDLSKMEIFR